MKGIIIDNDQTLGYEKNSLVRKAINTITIPFLNILPIKSRAILKKTHPSAKEIIEKAKTYKAMEILYNRPGSHCAHGIIQDFFLSIWLGTNNSKAVRNRLRLVKRELKKKIMSLVSEEKEIKIVNIASGAARAIIESLEELDLDKKISLSVVFADIDHEAITFSKNLTTNHKHKNFFKWVKSPAHDLLNLFSENKKFNIIEAVGLMEYLEDKEIIDLFSKAFIALDPGGIIITTNIRENGERRFISTVLGWKMTYRSADELVSLLMRGGFEFKKMKIYYEPQRIHCVVIAQK